jgi:hypothetical protein
LGFASYVATVREALVGVRSKAVIVTPFIDHAGIDFLQECWSNRSTKECAWEIYVRTVDRRLEKLASKNGWRLYEYPSAGDAGMHAKVVSTDEKRVILGSMNLLNRNMYTNLELGVDISEDPIVWKLAKLESWLREASRPHF